MADISNAAVFTNDVVTSSGTSDLLQQAFQQVVDEDEHDNEFVAFLQNDDNESQTIHLTPAQAAALGLTFEVNANEEVTYDEPGQDHAMANGQENDTHTSDINNMEDANASAANSTTAIEQLNFEGKNDGDDSNEEIGYEQWHVQNSSDGQLQNVAVENSVALDEIDPHGDSENAEADGNVRAQQNNAISQSPGAQSLLVERPKKQVSKTDEARFKEINVDEAARYTAKNDLTRSSKMNSISNSQAQILQKLPVILPSQFVIKPAQTILKPAKNIRLVQNPAKLLLSSVEPSSQSVGTTSSPNSILLSKTTLLNTASPQMAKTTPIAAQLLSASGISAQLLNNRQILAGPCQIAHQGMNPPHLSNTMMGSTSGSAQNVVTSQIRLSPMVKTAQTTLQRGHIQQFLTPVLKSTANIVQKSGQQASSGTTIAPAVSAQFVKSIQIPTQILKAAASGNVKKTSVVSTARTSANSNSTMILRTTSSVVKTQDTKSASSGPTSVLKSTQPSTAPVSILKPQSKMIAHENSIKQRVIANAQNIGGYANGGSQGLSQNLPPLQQAADSIDCTRSLQTDTVKRKYNPVSNGTTTTTNGRIGKKAKNISTVQKTISVGADPANSSKPLGSSENPIQIVQQGQTFHSVQRLTQMQLKQIAHVLQQRSQEATTSNEKIVYRVVFPEELDLRLRSPGNISKNRGGKRGRPKKNATKTAGISSPPKPLPLPDEEHHDESKDERKKVVARTRSGRLSRPPRHMVRDYKHLHHLDFSQPDLDDSDGGYSDYNTNSDKIEDEESSKELLAGLEVPKRKISDHFRCPTCSKIYLGRTRMARHFEMHPDHGSPEQLPPPTPPPEIKQNNGTDPLKRKGKKRGPWAYVTPEAKSERRQVKLKEAISVCEDLEIIKIAAKPVLNAQSLFDLLLLKSENNVRNFLNELKQLMDKIRERVGIMLTLVNNGEGEHSKDVIDINEELLCDALGLNPGIYRIHEEALKTSSSEQPTKVNYENDEPPLKLRKMDNTEDAKENIEERMSSGFSESSDLSVSDFLNEKKNESVTNPSCPEVLSALTLMRRNPSPVDCTESSGNNKSSNAVSKLLISNPEIQSQISDTPGFQKIDIGASNVPNFRKLEPITEEFAKLNENVAPTRTSEVFEKLQDNYEEKLESLEDAFIKLEPIEQNFVKMDSNAIESYQKQKLDKIRSSMDAVGSSGSQTFAKGFQKLVSKIIPMNTAALNREKTESSSTDACSPKILTTSVCKMSDGSLPMLPDTVVPIMSGTCDDGNIFGNAENLDMTKITQYDHIAHLDILNASGAIDKNLLIDEKLVEQLHLVDQSNLVDELVSERLKNIMPDTILEGSNLIANNSNLEADLDFEALSEEFNRNTSS